MTVSNVWISCFAIFIYILLHAGAWKEKLIMLSQQQEYKYKEVQKDMSTYDGA